MSSRLLVEWELTGNDASFRGPSFASPTLLRDSPEQVAIAEANAQGKVADSGVVTGSGRRATVSDLWLGLSHNKLVTIPKLGIDVGLAARVVMPTSQESRNTGFQAAPSLTLLLNRKLWRFDFGYGFRAAKYFYAEKVASIGKLDGTVSVNGQNVTPLSFDSSGTLTPNFGFVNFFTVGLELPKGFSLEADYFLFNVFANSQQREGT